MQKLNAHYSTNMSVFQVRLPRELLDRFKECAGQRYRELDIYAWRDNRGSASKRVRHMEIMDGVATMAY